MNFSEALFNLKNGRRVAREGWNGKGMWLVFQPHFMGIVRMVGETRIRLREPIKMFRPYILMKTAQDDFVPWLASQTDLLADDWIVGENM